MSNYIPLFKEEEKKESNKYLLDLEKIESIQNQNKELERLKDKKIQILTVSGALWEGKIDSYNLTSIVIRRKLTDELIRIPNGEIQNIYCEEDNIILGIE
jgi:hypothetical protein